MCLLALEGSTICCCCCCFLVKVFFRILADDMGLGKTVQIIALLLHEGAARKRNGNNGGTLIVCPLSVRRKMLCSFWLIDEKHQGLESVGTRIAETSCSWNAACQGGLILFNFIRLTMCLRCFMVPTEPIASRN